MWRSRVAARVAMPTCRHRLRAPGRRLSSVDDSLQAALARVAKAVQAKDPRAQLSEAAGVRTEGPKLLLRFTCTHEDCNLDEDASRVTDKMVGKNSYEKGAAEPPE